MTRNEFIKQLDFLIQDLDTQERNDLLNYYRDYLDEAGISDHDLVDGMLESPEKIAMSIRSTLHSDGEESLETNESGVYNFRVEDGSRVPNVYGTSEKDDDAFEKKTDFAGTKEESKSDHWGKLLLIIGLCVICLPIILGIGSGIIGLLVGIVGLVLSVILGVAATAISCLIGGIVLFILGILQVFVILPKGIFMMGIAMLLMAVGILSALLTGLIFKRWIPWGVRQIKAFIKAVFHRNGGVES